MTRAFASPCADTRTASRHPSFTDSARLRTSSSPDRSAMRPSIPDPDHLVVLTAGIGITPALAIARALLAADSDRRVDFVHVDKSRGTIPHWDEIEHAAQTAAERSAPPLPHGAWPQRWIYDTGRPSPAFVGSLIADPFVPRYTYAVRRPFCRTCEPLWWHPAWATTPSTLTPSTPPARTPSSPEKRRRRGLSGWSSRDRERSTSGTRPAERCSISQISRARVLRRAAGLVRAARVRSRSPATSSTRSTRSTPAPAGQALICCAVPTSDVVIA